MGTVGIQVQSCRLVRHFRGLPFQQMAFADPEPVQDANDGIRGEVGLVRKEGSLDDALDSDRCWLPASPARHPAIARSGGREIEREAESRGPAATRVLAAAGAAWQRPTEH